MNLDLQQIVFGDEPLVFWIEILIRTTILYSYAVFAVRLTPRRNIGQMTPLEILIIVALGSALGDLMFYPTVPLVHGMIVITVVLVLQTLLTRLAGDNARLEGLIEGEPIRIIHRGEMDIIGMRKANLSREDVFMQVRLHAYQHLGQIEHAYIETNGRVSIHPYRPDAVRTGLNVVPPVAYSDWTIYDGDDRVIATGDYACTRCGHVEHYHEGERFELDCVHCGGGRWTDAVTVPDHDNEYA